MSKTYDDLDRQQVEAMDRDELKNAAEVLLQCIRDLEQELGDKNRVDPATGRRMSNHEYQNWRAQATAEKNDKLSIYRIVKRQLQSLTEGPWNYYSYRRYFLLGLHLINELYQDMDDMSDEETHMIRELNAFAQSQGLKVEPPEGLF